MKNFSNWYDKNYKKVIIFPAILLVLSLSFLVYFYIQNDDIMHKDVSLTGGTTISIFTDIKSQELEAFLLTKISDLEVRTLLDNTGKQTQVIIIVSETTTDLAIELTEEFLGYELDSDNSSIETTSSALSSNFYKQLLSSIALAFFWMSAVVFLIFGKGKKLKFMVVVLNIIFGILLGKSITGKYSNITMIFVAILGVFLLYTYIRNSIPAFAVILSAFSDLIMMLAVVNLLGIRLSTAGIAAFLMMIGYSVDTDILLTTRVLKKRHSINQEMYDAFKTGITMTLTSLVAVAAALIVVYNFQSVLNQIFTILLIGLGFDIINTWTANASIIKWYAEKNK
jgi:preprotein translocase subunit SecF